MILQRFLTTMTILLMICGFSSQVWAGFWGLEDGQCSEPSSPSSMTWLSNADVSTAADQAIDDENPCSPDTFDETDPSSAVCFEDGGPVSTIPDLLAAMQAERAVAHIVRAARANTIIADTRIASVESVAPTQGVRPWRMPTQECSSFDVQCGAEDPIPAMLNLEMSRTVGVEPLMAFDAPIYPRIEVRGEPHANHGIADLRRFVDVDMPPPRLV